MRNILRLTRRDVRHATSNVMAVIVVFGLTVIPALFTWFNVIASWDPFANTANLRVAVASTDKGYQSDLVPVRINVGEQVLAAVRANDDFDWIVTSEEDAIDGTRSGAYYAAIVLPESFSADMLTFYTADAERTPIAYYTNEKKNALAPKITDQGAEGISTLISRSFSETLGEIALGLVSSLSDFLSEGDVQAALPRLEARLGGIADQLRAAATTADAFSALIESSLPLVDGAAELIAASDAAFDDASNALGQGTAAVGTLKSTLATATRSLDDALSATADGYGAVAVAIDDLYGHVDELTDSQAQVIGSLSGLVAQQIDAVVDVRDTLRDEIGPGLPASAQPALKEVVDRLDEAIARQQDARDRLDGAAQDLTNSSDAAQARRQQIADALAAAKTAVDDARSAYSDRLRPQLDDLSATLATIADDVSAIGADLSGTSDALAEAPANVRAALSQAQSATQRISSSLTEAAETFERVEGALAASADTGHLGDLAEVIGADPSLLAASLVEPVSLERIPVFPVVSFGAAMAPLYLVLSLWVGALLMTVAIRVDVNSRTLPDQPEPAPTEKYFGRYAIFALVGLAQSTLVTTGLILFVEIEPAHPFLFILSGWVTSLVFTLVIYTFVVAFGNAGKALAVLLLVIQISGAGGAYPLQLLPQWFQNISPFLPATHAIDAVRAAIAGLHGGDYWVSLGLLALFLVPTLLLGVVLRRPLISFNRGLAEALESSKLM